jgi:hypothetical protein
MKNRMLAVTLLAGGLFSLQAAAQQCEAPAEVTVPSGATATLDQMLEAQAQVKSFLAAMETYLDCMNTSIEALPADAPAEQRGALVELYNAGVMSMEGTAAKFNEERVAYQEAHPAK